MRLTLPREASSVMGRRRGRSSGGSVCSPCSTTSSTAATRKFFDDLGRATLAGVDAEAEGNASTRDTLRMLRTVLGNAASTYIAEAFLYAIRHPAVQAET